MAFTGVLGTADSRPGNVMLGTVSVGGGGGGEGYDPLKINWLGNSHHDTVPIEAAARRRRLRTYVTPMVLGDVVRSDDETFPKFHVSLAEPPRPSARLRDNRFTTARGQLGDVERPDAVDPLPGSRPLWHVPLSQPPRPATSMLDRRHLMPTYAFGEPPAPEPVTLDRFAGSCALPPGRLPPRPPVEDYAIDVSHLGDAELVRLPAFDVPMGRVILARPPAPRLPGGEMLEPTLIPESPIATDMPPWHVALTAAPPRLATRRPHETYPDGSLVLHPSLVFEAPEIKFHTPLQIPALRRRPGVPDVPVGGIDLDDAQRPEVLFTAAVIQVLALPPDRRRRTLELSRVELAIEQTLTAESPHAEVLVRQEIAVPPRALPPGASVVVDTSWIIDANFEYPLYLRVRLGMLAGGLWRARG